MNFLKSLFGPSRKQLATRAARAAQMRALEAAARARELRAETAKVRELETAASQVIDLTFPSYYDSADRALFKMGAETVAYKAADELIGILIHSKNEEATLTDIAQNHEIKRVRDAAEKRLAKIRGS